MVKVGWKGRRVICAELSAVKQFVPTHAPTVSDVSVETIWVTIGAIDETSPVGPPPPKKPPPKHQNCPGHPASGPPIRVTQPPNCGALGSVFATTMVALGAGSDPPMVLLWSMVMDFT